MDRTFYSDFQNNWDDHLFRKEILRALKPDMRLLDLGAGAGILKQMNFRGIAASVSGLDPDPRVIDNPYLDDSEIGIAEELPYPNRSFDLVFANNLMEHVSQPERVFFEVARVLRPGGMFLFKTPNASHYVPVLARLTPEWFHKIFNKKRGRMEADTFPTLYRVNTADRVHHLAMLAGLEVPRIMLIEGRPEYLRFNPITYLLGFLYERLVNNLNCLARFRVLILAILRKPDCQQTNLEPLRSER